jgi:hypothetical protein
MPEELEYDIIERRMGGQRLLAAFCSDGCVHLFSFLGEGEPVFPPTSDTVCGSGAKLSRAASDKDPMCASCAAAAESWAEGGSLKVSALS